MEAKKILEADLLDLLFENRNKEYGAYALRKNYSKRIFTALGIALLIAAVSFSTALIDFGGKKAVLDEVEVRDVVVQNIQEIKPPPPPPPKKEETPPPPPKAPEKPMPAPPKVQTTQFTPPVIKPDIEVKEVAPPVREMTKVDVVTSTEGVKDKGIVSNLPPVMSGTPTGTGVVEAPPQPKEDPNKIFEKVEIEASVNMSQWRRHLQNQLQRPIENAAADGMAPGKYTVNVRFLVEKDGSITNVKALNNPGFGLGRAAEDVVKRGPKWTPGEQNGQKVRSYHTQPITFVISDGVF